MNPLSNSWYPSCVVKLTMRFDEALQVTKPKDEVSIQGKAAQTQEARVTGSVDGQNLGGDQALDTGQHRPRRAMNEPTDAARQRANTAFAQLDEVRPIPASSFATPSPSAIANGGGTQVPESTTEPITFGTDGFTVIANRVPKKGSFTLPHPRTAPTFQLTFDYKEFPIDPRLLRAVGVEIHLGAVSSSDFAAGMMGGTDSNGRPLSILKTTSGVVDPVTGREGPNNGTLLFYGTCDTWDVEHGGGGSMIVLEGREIRAILIDSKVVPSKIENIDLDQPITKVIADLIKSIGFEHDFRLTVMTDVGEWPDGIEPTPGDADGLTRVRQGASGEKAQSQAANGSGGSGKTSYWDLITNYCEIVGAMPHIVGSTLWIRPTHRIFDVVSPRSKIPTPFAGGKPRTVGEEEIRARRMVFGRDLKKLKFQRKFGGVAIVPTVQCISYDDRAVGTQRLIFGQWPEADAAAAQAKGENEMLRVPMWGIRSVKQLTEIARGIYEEVGRGETGGTAETTNLATFGGDNTDPDLLRLRPLEPIEFVIDASALQTIAPVVSELNNNARLTFAQEVDVLHKRIGDRQIARALVALRRGAIPELLQFYQVVGVQFDFDKGIRTQLQFQNYIVTRHAAKSVSDTDDAPNVQATAVQVTGANRKSKVDVSQTQWGGAPRASIGKATGKGPELVSRPRQLSLQRIDDNKFGRSERK